MIPLIALLAHEAAGDRSLRQSGYRRDQVNRPSCKVLGALAKGSAPGAPRFRGFGARELPELRSQALNAVLAGAVLAGASRNQITQSTCAAFCGALSHALYVYS